MGILTGGIDGTVIRVNGVERALAAADFATAETNAEIEARLSNAARTLLGREVSIHIFSRSPLSFSVRTAPLGSVVPVDWWNWNPS